MKRKQYYETLSVLIVVIVVLVAICLIGCVALAIVKVTAPSSNNPPEDHETDTSDIPTNITPTVTYELTATADQGLSYLDEMIFFGESTTAHLRARGVLNGGTQTHQVWADASGTKRLSSKITSETIVYPQTGESITIIEACALAKPKYIVLSFGLNGIVDFANNKSLYINNYNSLINAIQQVSPNTKIILQTVYPIAESNTDFSVDALTVDRYIMTLNTWLPEIASAHDNVRYVDTASVLRNEMNALFPAYTTGDGIHLTTEAYQKILQYLRTHAWE